MLTTDRAGSRAEVSVRGHLPIESGLNHHPVPSAKGHGAAGDAVLVVGAQSAWTVGMDGGCCHLACGGGGLMLRGIETQRRLGG